jgi:hypothetical protein
VLSAPFDIFCLLVIRVYQKKIVSALLCMKTHIKLATPKWWSELDSRSDYKSVAEMPCGHQR